MLSIELGMLGATVEEIAAGRVSVPDGIVVNVVSVVLWEPVVDDG